MPQSTQPISPLHQRMIDDMRLRKLSPKTQTGYIRAVRQLAGFLGRSADSATAEGLRRNQLHLIDHGISPVSLNATLTTVKIVFEVTADRPEAIAKMHRLRVPRMPPVVLSRDEAARLIAAAPSLKYLPRCRSASRSVTSTVSARPCMSSWAKADKVHRPNFAGQAYYACGLPMGGDLVAAERGKAPRFMSRALRDPDGANLDRIKTVKGWLDKDGKAQERI